MVGGGVYAFVYAVPLLFMFASAAAPAGSIKCHRMVVQSSNGLQFFKPLKENETTCDQCASYVCVNSVTNKYVYGKGCHQDLIDDCADDYLERNGDFIKAKGDYCTPSYGYSFCMKDLCNDKKLLDDCMENEMHQKFEIGNYTYASFKLEDATTTIATTTASQKTTKKAPATTVKTTTIKASSKVQTSPAKTAAVSTENPKPTVTTTTKAADPQDGDEVEDDDSNARGQEEGVLKVVAAIVGAAAFLLI